MRPFHVAGGVKAFYAGQTLGRPHAFVGERDGVFLFLDFEVRVFRELAGKLIGLAVFGDIVVRGAGDDERGAGLVNQNVVYLVDDGVMQRALHLLHEFGKVMVAAGRRAHVVAQIVEAELVVGAVSDIASVGLLTLGPFHAGLNGADRQTQPHVQRGHPFHVAAGQIVVHRDDVHPLAFQRVKIGGQRGH